jgi:CRP-like cAMP-binding protein
MPADPGAPDEGQRELDVRVGLGLSASDDQLDALLAIARQVDAPAEHVLHERGAVVTSIFLLVRGSVELRAPDAASRPVDEGATIGFADFLIARPHARTAVTTAPSRLLQVDAADYREYLEDQFELGRRILVRTSELALAALLEHPALLGNTAEGSHRSFADIEVPMVERLMMLSRMPVFRGGSMQGLADLAQVASEVRFEAGDEIVPAGPRSSRVAFLVEGEVELALPSGVRVRRSARDLLAHVEELATAPRQCSVTALTPTIVLQVEREDLLDLLEEHFDLFTATLAYVAEEQDKLDELATRVDDSGTMPS